MQTPYDVLGELWWRDDRDFSLVAIEYVSRGSPGDVGVVHGNDVVHVEKTFFVLSSGATIPFHRVLRIEYSGEPVYQRR